MVDILDGPPVAVLDPVVHAQAKPAVVGSGEDGVADEAGVAVGQGAPGPGIPAGQAVGLRLQVERGDEVSGGGEHERVEARSSVGGPGGEYVGGDGGEVADVDPVVVEVEPEGLGAAFPKRQGGGAFDGVGEPHQLVQVQRAVGGGDVAQDTAGADRGELLGVADEPDLPAAGGDEGDGGVQGEGVGHPGLVDDHQRARADRVGPVGQVVVCRDQVSLARVSVVAPVCSRRTAAAAAEGASPRTVPPSSTHAAARARMAVVFPVPAGAMASWSRLPEVAICVTRAVCPGLRVVPLAACSSRARVDRVRLARCPSTRPAVCTRRCSAARMSSLV